MKPLVTHDLNCGYASCAVLRDVNVSLESSRFACIVGPNGIGKSTLLRTVTGLLPPLSGSVHLHDRPIESMSPQERARSTSIVLTGLPSVGYLSVRQFVGIGRHPYTGTLGRLSATDREAVEHAIAQVGVESLAERWLSTLSDGERQRVAIARAFAQAAELMILDEPTAFLDVESRAAVMITLRNLAHREGRSIVAASHDIDLVLRIADVVWMIEPGGSIVVGAPEDLVLSGVLTRVFPRHVMEFDLDLGSFRMPRPNGPGVAVCGAGHRATWTARALERIGLQVSIMRPGETPSPEVAVVMLEEDQTWSVRDSRSNPIMVRRLADPASCTRIAEVVDLFRKQV